MWRRPKSGVCVFGVLGLESRLQPATCLHTAAHAIPPRAVSHAFAVHGSTVQRPAAMHPLSDRIRRQISSHRSRHRLSHAPSRGLAHLKKIEINRGHQNSTWKRRCNQAPNAFTPIHTSEHLSTHVTEISLLSSVRRQTL